MRSSDREPGALAGPVTSAPPSARDVQRSHAADGVRPWVQRNPLWQIKLRLQFTGWLQYLAPIGPALLLLAVAGVGALIGGARVLLVGLPLTLGLLLLLVVAVDLVTVRLDVRPREPHPPRMDDLDVFDIMRARRSCRSFQHRTLTDDDRAALLAWAEEHTRPRTLLGTAPIRLEYLAVPLTVWPAVGAHEFLVAVAPRDYDRVAIIDVGRSLQKIVIEATRAGISTCWIGPGADQSSIKAALGDRFDPAHDHVICVCAIGYRSRFVPLLIRAMTAKMHTRLPPTQLFFADDDLTRPLDVTAPPYSEFGRCYEVCQWSPSSYNGQTTRAIVQATDAVHRVDFATSTSSRYYAPVALGIWLANWETGCQALDIHGRTTVLPEHPTDTTDTPGRLTYGATWLRDHPATT